MELSHSLTSVVEFLSCVDWINLSWVSVCVDTEMKRQFVTSSGNHPLLNTNPLGLPERQSLSKDILSGGNDLSCSNVQQHDVILTERDLFNCVGILSATF